jgi:hypothetical protein
LDRVPLEVETRVLTRADSDLPGSKEASVCEAKHGIESGVAWDDTWPELCKDGKEDGEGDGLDGFPVLLTVETFDPTDEALDDGRLANGEGEVSVNVQGMNCRQVVFDGFGLHAASEAGDPTHDGGLRSRKEGTVGVVQAVKSAEVDEGPLSSGVGSVGVRREPVPKVK